MTSVELYIENHTGAQTDCRADWMPTAQRNDYYPQVIETFDHVPTQAEQEKALNDFIYDEARNDGLRQSQLGQQTHVPSSTWYSSGGGSHEGRGTLLKTSTTTCKYHHSTSGTYHEVEIECEWEFHPSLPTAAVEGSS